jgi:hypothetical protein
MLGEHDDLSGRAARNAAPCPVRRRGKTALVSFGRGSQPDSYTSRAISAPSIQSDLMQHLALQLIGGNDSALPCPALAPDALQ